MIIWSCTKSLRLAQYESQFLVWHKIFGAVQNILGPAVTRLLSNPSFWYILWSYEVCKCVHFSLSHVNSCLQSLSVKQTVSKPPWLKPWPKLKNKLISNPNIVKSIGLGPKFNQLSSTLIHSIQSIKSNHINSIN